MRASAGGTGPATYRWISPTTPARSSSYTFHASFGGTDRLAWAIEYLAEPASDDARDKTLRWLGDAFEQDCQGFDTERYPTWRDWLANPTGHARRAEVIGRLDEAGVLDLPGAEVGW